MIYGMAYNSPFYEVRINMMIGLAPCMKMDASTNMIFEKLTAFYHQLYDLEKVHKIKAINDDDFNDMYDDICEGKESDDDKKFPFWLCLLKDHGDHNIQIPIRSLLHMM